MIQHLFLPCSATNKIAQVSHLSLEGLVPFQISGSLVVSWPWLSDGFKKRSDSILYLNFSCFQDKSNFAVVVATYKLRRWKCQTFFWGTNSPPWKLQQILSRISWIWKCVPCKKKKESSPLLFFQIVSFPHFFSYHLLLGFWLDILISHSPWPPFPPSGVRTG